MRFVAQPASRAARGGTRLTLLAALGLSGVAEAQVRDPRPEARASELDPFLWASIAPAVKAAHEAEIDPKRGPENARQILKREKTRHDAARVRTALDLRIAATSLRERFLRAEGFPERMRKAQALSTYSRLDLAEPGLARALRAVLEARREAGEEVPASLSVKVAVLARTRSFDPGAFEARLAEAFENAGVELERAAPKEADFVLKVGTRDLSAKSTRRTVTVSLDLEQREGGEVVWRSSSFRTSAADSIDAALDAGLAWLARIGGRDLLFRFLADGPVPELSALAPRKRGPPHRHGH
jgi:hypothetical protein